jgi:putative spermidine/putrescine transport system ATP-binding protein/spermidine/putrescine transport system ATP-binding protein
MSSVPAESAHVGTLEQVAAAKPQDVAVRLDGITKRFGDVVALADVWLRVYRGEFMTLLGPSGCGKTTLLNLVAGFFSPDGGEILIDGAVVNEVPTFQREIGIVFQNYALFPHMTVADNVAYGLRARGIARDEIARRLGDSLAIMKLTGLEDRKPRQLSGGQQQRVALARALVIRPRVLLLDEPFSALDKHLRASMQVEIKEIQRKLGVTTIFVTHDQSEALSLSDRVAVIFEGRIRQLDTPHQIYRRPVDRTIASFIGEGSVLRARLERIDDRVAMVMVGSSHISVPAQPLTGLTSGALVDLFVRPEQLRIATDHEAFKGSVIATSFQGDHVDVYVDVPDAASTRVQVRVPFVERAPSVGDRIAVAIDGCEATAFPNEE